MYILYDIVYRVSRGEIQKVFEMAKTDDGKRIPVLMVTSGGYQRNNARIIADSILNLRQKGLIGCQASEHYQGTEDDGTRGRGGGMCSCFRN